MKLKRGISLAVLVITIIVVGVLATAVIMSVDENNSIESARESTFKNDLKAIQESIESFVSEKTFENLGEYSKSKFTKEDLENLEIIKDNSKYQNKFDVVNGNLMVNSNFTSDEIKWAKDLGIEFNDK